jgi:hypothetical protein
MTEFTPFIEPSREGGQALFHTVGLDYICTGCGGTIPGGAWFFENIEDGMVVGIIARAGGADAPIVHQCGEVD